MKTTIAVVIFITLMCLSSITAAQNLIPVHKLSISKHVFGDILLKLQTEKDSLEFNQNTQIFVIVIQKSDDFYELWTTFIDQVSLEIYVFHTKEKLMGYFDHEHTPVFVFGKAAKHFFVETEQTAMFEYLDGLNIEKLEKAKK
jgi:hypothetical protein